MLMLKRIKRESPSYHIDASPFLLDVSKESLHELASVVVGSANHDPCI